MLVRQPHRVATGSSVFGFIRRKQSRRNCRYTYIVKHFLGTVVGAQAGFGIPPPALVRPALPTSSALEL